MPRALLLGVLAVIAIYSLINFAYLRTLGAAGLAATTTPASTAMHALLGERGAKIIAAGIAFSAFGFLAQSMLTAPRVYFAMAADGAFFRSVAQSASDHACSRSWPSRLQGVWAIVIALSGTYAQVVNYVVAMDAIFFGLTACCLFVLRKRNGPAWFTVPLHPWTTLFFIAANWIVVVATFAHDPVRSFIGLGIALAGLPVFLIWRAPQLVNPSMRPKSSDYMEWAKLRSHARFNLATSGIRSVTADEFSAPDEQLEINAPGAYGYAPLQERIARHEGVAPECIVAAAGTSMANHLAMAAVLEPGDEVLIEQPTYGLLLDPAQLSRRAGPAISAQMENGFAVDPDEIATTGHPQTKLIVLTNLHNPTGALIDEETSAHNRRVAAATWCVCFAR